MPSSTTASKEEIKSSRSRLKLDYLKEDIHCNVNHCKDINQQQDAISPPPKFKQIPTELTNS